MFSLAFACFSFHFLKREFETLFVHRFSHSSMPLINLFKNSVHYWFLSGFLIAYFLYSPSFVSPPLPMVLTSALVFVTAELGNFYCHFLLKNIRPAGSTERKIPHGFAFELVSCPNYSFEILAWISFAVMTGLWSSWLFAAVGGLQMYLWAVKKHHRYLKEFKDYPRQRKMLVPYVI